MKISASVTSDGVHSGSGWMFRNISQSAFFSLIITIYVCVFVLHQGMTGFGELFCF